MLVSKLFTEVDRASSNREQMIDMTIPSQIHRENNTEVTRFSAPRDNNTIKFEKVRTGMTTKAEVDRFQTFRSIAQDDRASRSAWSGQHGEDLNP